MKNFKNLVSKRILENAIAGCIVVAFFLIVSNLGIVFNGISGFIGNFATIFEGIALAYIMNPLAKYYSKTFFRKIKSDSVKWSVSVSLSVATILLSVILILVILIPQLLASVTNFLANIRSYAASLVKMLDELSGSMSESSKAESLQNLLDSSEGILNTIVDYISDNSKNIISASTSAGKDVAEWVIAFIVSIYILFAKQKFKTGLKRFFKVTMKKEVYDSSVTVLVRCNEILNRYIIYDLIDSFLVGVINALLMLIFGMKYVGLVSVVVGVTNLVPTFGPVIGAVIGAFVLLMIKPSHAVIFLVFTLILQIMDGYVIKPKLFGNTFGVSGLLILLSVIVGGKFFGVVGILLAIPIAAICDYLYKEIFIHMLEKHQKDLSRKNETIDESSESSPDDTETT